MNNTIKPAKLTKHQIKLLKASALLIIGTKNKGALKCIDDLIGGGICRPFWWNGSKQHITANDVSVVVASALNLANEYGGANINFIFGNDAKRKGKAGDFIKILKKHFVSNVYIYSKYVNIILSNGKNYKLSFENNALDVYDIAECIASDFANPLRQRVLNLDFNAFTKFVDEREYKHEVFYLVLNEFSEVSHN